MKYARCVLLVFAAMAAGCIPENHASYRKSWERVQLPGFSLLLPRGKVVEASSVPSNGKHQREIKRSLVDHWLKDIVTNGSALAAWSPEATTLEEWKKEYLPLLISALEPAVPGARLLEGEQLGADQWYVVVGTPRIPIAIGTIHCDEKFEVQITYAHYHDARRQVADLREIMDSVECAVTEANLIKTQAATRLPEKFGRVSNPDVQEYQSLDGEFVGLNFTAGDMQSSPDIYRTVIRGIVSNSFGVKVEDSRMESVDIPPVLRQAPTLLFRIRLPEDNGSVYVGTQYCDGLKLSLISIHTAPNASDKLAIERLSQVGCPGTPFTSLPSYESLVEAACQAGDANACAIKSGTAGS